MSTPVVWQGVSYSIPAFGDVGYAQGPGNLSSYLIALANGVQTSGGLFSLTAPLNFGPNFGVLAVNFTTTDANPATAGTIRLSNTDTIDWRNFANTGNDVLGVNASDQLTYNGVVITTAATAAITALTGDVTATGPGSVPATLATVNPNVGSFTNASITVNGKGLITAAASGTAPVTSVSGTANQIDSTGGATPVLSIDPAFIFPGTISANTHKITSLSNGTAATDAAAFGQIKVFQTVIGASTTEVSGSSTVYVSTLLSVTITPTSASNRVALWVSGACGGTGAVAQNIIFTIKRGAVDLDSSGNGFVIYRPDLAVEAAVPVGIVFIDSPATTSATVYTVFLRTTSATLSYDWSAGTNNNQIMAMEIV